MRTSLPTAKKVPFCSFDGNVSKPKKRYLSRAFEEIASNWKKVPFSLLKVLFGKVRNGWKAGNIDNKIFSPESLKYPPIFSKKVPFLQRQLRRVFWRQFRAIARLRTMFCTSLIENGFLKFSRRFWFFFNFEQQDSCARCLAQVLAS